VIRIVKSLKTPEWGAAPSIIEDSTFMLEGESLQNYEGKTPKMGSAVRNVSPRRRSNLSGDTGPGDPYSSVKGFLVANNSLIVRETRPRVATKLFEDSVHETLAVETVQVNEGVAPRMWSTAIVAVGAQRDGDQEGVTDPYAVLLGNKRSEAESARTSREVHLFEGRE